MIDRSLFSSVSLFLKYWLYEHVNKKKINEWVADNDDFGDTWRDAAMI